jgi:uncharacterized protein (TIGR00369 family)
MERSSTTEAVPSLRERVERLARGEGEPPGIARTLGLRLVSAEGGEASFAMTVGEAHHNPMGTVHGGILCDLGDAAMGVAFASRLEAGETFTTLELKANFLRPVWQGELTAHARVLSRGRTVGLVECAVTDARGRQIAHLTSTCMVLRGEAAHGR